MSGTLPPDTLPCRRCHQELPFDDFSNGARSEKRWDKDPWCKTCRRAYARERWHNRKDKRTALYSNVDKGSVPVVGGMSPERLVEAMEENRRFIDVVRLEDHLAARGFE